MARSERSNKASEMSRRARHPPPAASRRTRRAEQPAAAALAAEGPKIVSNPIFRCEAGPSQPKPPPPPPGDHHLRCVYHPGSLYALVHDPAAGDGIPKPLPLPPCRAHRAGSHVPASRVVAGGPHGRVLRRAPPPPQDPFLAAYVACSKSDAGGMDAAGGVDRRQHKQRQGKKKKKKKEGREGEDVVQGCRGIWSGWAAGAKYAGAMSCRHGCTVAKQRRGDGSAKEGEEDAAAGPTLDLSWAPVVLSVRALERRREQR